MTTTPEYRYERKFALTELDRGELETVLRLNPGAFTEIFHSRWVNSIYLDTIDGEGFETNVSGVSANRIKFRIRWYGALEGFTERPMLELKIKRGTVNRKRTFPLSGFALGPHLSAAVVKERLANAAMPDSLRRELSGLELVLLNRYRRTYYLSADRRFRATLDSEQSFHALRSRGQQPALVGGFVRAEGRVLELKYAPGDDRDAGRITQGFPFRLTRNSKFAVGIELTRARLGIA